MKDEEQIRKGIKAIERTIGLPFATQAQKAMGKASIETLKWVLS